MKHFIWSFLMTSLFLISSCSKDDNKEPEVSKIPETVEEVKTLIAKRWVVEDQTSEYVSFDFKPDLTYIVVKKSPVKSVTSITLIDTYTVDSKDQVTMNGFGLLELTALSDNDFSFKVTPPGGKEETVVTKFGKLYLPKTITRGKNSWGISYVYTYYYNSLNALAKVEILEKNDSLSHFQTCVITYGNTKITSVVSHSSGEKFVTEYRFLDSEVRIFSTNKSDSLRMREILEIGEYGVIKSMSEGDELGILDSWEWSAAYEYDHVGNLTKRPAIGFASPYICTYDDKNGIFKNVQSPNWFLHERLSIQPFTAPYFIINNLLTKEEVKQGIKTWPDTFTYKYNDANYPTQFTFTTGKAKSSTVFDIVYY